MICVKVPESRSTENEPQVREITAEEEEAMHQVVMNAFACQSVQQTKKMTLQTSVDPASTIQEMVGNPQRQYLEVVDFDEHFDDISLDWTNPDFE